MGSRELSTRNLDLTVINFIPEQSIQQREAARAKALSHAARISHQRKKSKSHDIRIVPRRTQSRSHHAHSDTNRPNNDLEYTTLRGPGGGNGDPFDTMPVSITSETYSLLAVLQAHLSNHPVDWQAQLPNKSIVRGSQISPSTFLGHPSLNGELHLRCLLYLGLVMLSTTHWRHSGLRIRTLKHRISCYEGIRQTFSPAGSRSDRSALLRNLSSIFIAALLINDRSEALLHATKIRDEIAASLTVPSSIQEERATVLGFMHYYDNLCALRHLRPPILGIQLLESVWSAADMKLKHGIKSLASTEWWFQNNPSPSSIVRTPTFDQHLEMVFSNCQRLVTHPTHSLSQDTPKSTMITLLIACVQTERTILLLTQAKRARRQYEIDHDNMSCAAMVLSAALLAWYAGRMTGPVVGTYRVTAYRAMAALQKCIGNMEGHVRDSPGILMFQHVVLWTLYIGAMWEWDSGVYWSDESWFIPRLQAKVFELGLTSWSEFIAVCDQFIYLRNEQMRTSAWFPGMEWPRNLAWAGAGRQQKSSASFLRELLFNSKDAATIDGRNPNSAPSFRLAFNTPKSMSQASRSQQ
jgi:hypothetical protein